MAERGTDVRDGLALVDALEADGRLLEAVDALSEVNRARGDAELERRLLRLRHEAAAHVAQDEAPPAWPAYADVATDDSPDPCPVPSHDLSPGLIRHRILRDGYVHARGVLPLHDVDRLVAGIDLAFAAAEAPGSSAPPEDRTRWFEPFRSADRYGKAARRQLGNRRRFVIGAGGVWTADSPRMMFEFFEALRDAGVLRLVNEYLGERPLVAVDKCTLRRVSAGASADWHQDGAFLGRGIRALNVWVCLSHCGSDAPGLDIVPKRFDDLVETGTDGAAFAWTVGHGAVERAAHDAPVRRPTFEPGDVMFFDELFLHRTAREPTMSRDRHAVETWFFGPSAYPSQYVPLVV